MASLAVADIFSELDNTDLVIEETVEYLIIIIWYMSFNFKHPVLSQFYSNIAVSNISHRVAQDDH